MDLQLAGKRALVTGSSSGIGSGVARMLAAEGARVIVHGRNRERAEAVAASIREAGGEAHVLIGDLATDEGGTAVGQGALDLLGGIDILVNNAGGSAGPAGARWAEVPEDVWIASYQKNVIAAVRLVRLLLPGMKEQGWGRVIQVTSAAGTQPVPFAPDYGAAKGAMLNLSVSLSKALAGTGVTANSVSPGRTLTPAVERAFAGRSTNASWGGPSATVPIGTIDEVAYAVVMVASPRASFITGAHIRADGGQVQSVN